MSDNVYSNCNSAYKGSIFRIANGSQVEDEGSTFTLNSALFGGVAYVENINSRININSPTKVSVNRAYYGGFLYLV